MSTGEGETTTRRNPLYRTRYESDGHKSVSAAVVEAIATVKDIDPVTGEFCLYDYLDTDALDALVASQNAELSLTFTIDMHTVTIRSDGTVAITESATSVTQ